MSTSLSQCPHHPAWTCAGPVHTATVSEFMCASVLRCLEGIASSLSSIPSGFYCDSSSESFLNWALFLLVFSGLTTKTKNWHNFQMCELIQLTIMNKETKIKTSSTDYGCEY